MKVLLLAAMWIGLASTQTGLATVVTLADKTANAATQQLSSSAISARWVLFIALSTNSAVVRIGDSLTATTQGAAVAAGGGLLLPALPVDQRNANNQQLYNLSKLFFFGASGDKISVVYGR